MPAQQVPNQPTIPVADAVNWIKTKSNAKIFSIKFVKRSTGEVREMVCNYGTKARAVGGEQPYDPTLHNLITVFDMAVGKNKNANGYRSISIEGITDIKISGVWHTVVHPQPTTV
jgi:hypothetical protein